jgi:outer membrane murein-binding lipoprotein Lpp
MNALKHLNLSMEGAIEMKNNTFLAALTSLFLLVGCGVSKDEYDNVVSENQKLKETISQLENELDLYKNSEPRLFAIIDQSVKSGDISAAKENIALFEKYHPESMDKTEIKQIIADIEKEEAKIAQIAAEKEASEKAAALERQKGFNDPHAATSRVIDVIEADFFAESNKLNNGEYVIIRPGYYDEQSGNRIFLYSERYFSEKRKRIGVYVDDLFKINSGARVSVLVQTRYGKTVLGAERCFFNLIELQKY